uniref:SseB protein N-terminal domain-containing protein n=1 Tax=Streptomyces sp. NBC_00049 TaxID=2903617 RepID=A0AAU2JR71_9ACTN
MPLLNTLARLQAVRAGRAQPLATVRHRHLGERPLVLVPLTTAGEAGAPLGALVGTDPAEPRLLVVAQPRDRDLRWAFLADLADEVLPYVDSYADAVELVERNETDPETGKKAKVEAELCLDAPQLIVPSRAGIEYVRLLGRSMRFRRTAEEDPDNPYPAPVRVPLLGRWFTHLGERSRVPGSSMLVSATELLGRHWASGQSNLEDQHLGALLAWIAPPEGESGAEEALRAELARDRDGQLLVPPAGPATDPAFDNRLLAPAMARYDAARSAEPFDADAFARAEAAVRALVAAQMKPTWDAVWRSLELLRTLPAGERAEERWTRDRWSYTGHRDRVRAGEPPQPRRDDAVTAAQKLATRETEQVRLDAQEALDDPLVMAGRRLAGEAFAGEVTEVVMEWTESKRPSPRPLLTVATEDRPQLADGGGGKVFRSLDGRPQSAQFVRFEEDGQLVLRLLDKMGRGRDPEPGSVPEKGDRVTWTLFEHDARGGPKLPDPEQTPWTHGGPPGHASSVPLPDTVTDEDLL